jgi:hypothetical protein
LREAQAESDVEDNVQAVASAKQRRKTAHTVKQHKQPRAGDAETEPDSDGPAAVSRTKSGKTVTKIKRRPRNPSPQAVHSDEPDHRPTSPLRQPGKMPNTVGFALKILFNFFFLHWTSRKIKTGLKKFRFLLGPL